MSAPKNNLQEDKPQLSLIPLDILEELLEPAYREGLKKYYRESWRQGFPATVMMDAALRHLTAFFYDREDFDAESASHGVQKHHLGGAIFSILSLYNSLKINPELFDDRPGAKSQNVSEL